MAAHVEILANVEITAHAQRLLGRELTMDVHVVTLANAVTIALAQRLLVKGPVEQKDVNAEILVNVVLIARVIQ